MLNRIINRATIKRLLQLILVITISGQVFAVNVQQFSRSNSLTFEMIEDARLSSSHVINHYEWLFNLGFSYVDQPLVIKNADNSEQIDSIIDSMQSIHLGAAIYLKPWWQVAINTSFSQFKNNSDETVNGFQDIELKSKFRVYNGKRNAFTIMPLISIPTKSGNTEIRDNSSPANSFGSDNLLSDDGLGVGVFGIYEHLFRTFQVSFNLGYRMNSDAKFVDISGVTQIDKSELITAGVGVYIPFIDTLGINIEYLTNFTSPLFNDDLTPSELFLGVSGGLRDNIHGFAGASFGNFFSSSDGNDYRIVAGLKFTPGTKRKNFEERLQKEAVKPNRIIEDYKSTSICEKSYLFQNTNALSILFDHNSDQLSERQKGLIEEILTKIEKRNIDIESIELYGHTSSTGDELYNQDLGLRRAKKIKDLLADYQVSAEKVKTIKSFGETDLLEEENTQENKQANRRVEVFFKLNEKFRGCYE